MPDRLTEPVMDPGFLDNYVKKTDYVICGVSAGIPAGTFLAAGIRASYEKVYRDTKPVHKGICSIGADRCDIIKSDLQNRYLKYRYFTNDVSMEQDCEKM